MIGRQVRQASRTRRGWRGPAIALAAFTATAGLALATPVGAFAHGVIVGRQDLPIPRWLFAWGAALVLIISFGALAFAWHRSRFEEDSWHPLPAGLSRAVVNPVTRFLAGAIGVFLLGLVIYAGLEGTAAPDRNFAVGFTFVTFWLGFVFASVLLGDVFRAFNPWRAIGRAFGSVFALIAGQERPAPFAYPERLGRWPAAIVIGLFLWFELVWSIAFQSVGVTPHDVGIAAAVYTVYTLVGMLLFGVETWCDRAEGFSVLYGMFSRVAALEVRDGRLGARRWLSGTTSWVGPAGSLALLMIVIGGTAYDGAAEGFLSGANESLYGFFHDDVGLGVLFAFRLSNTLLLLAMIGLVSAVFWAGIAGMHTVRTDLSVGELARRFAHSFIPIAIAYLIAHYFSLVWFLEQAQFTFLLSDPLGTGADIFGTASGSIDYGSISASAVWYVQVGALVLGHALALVLGHDRAIALYGDSRSATWSQAWMLALMVAFTCFGLFLLSQSNA